MAIKQVLSAPRSPWQRAYVERVIGTIRRECLDRMIVFSEQSLYQHLEGFLEYYHRNRTHLALEKDSPKPRPVQASESGRIHSRAGRLASSLRTARSIKSAIEIIQLSGRVCTDRPLCTGPIAD